MASAKQKYIEMKMKKIYAEGIRGKPPVSRAQAFAVANSYWDRNKKGT